DRSFRRVGPTLSDGGTRQVHHRVAARERVFELVFTTAGREQLDIRPQLAAGARDIANKGHDLVPLALSRQAQRPADDARRAGDEDPHERPRPANSGACTTSRRPPPGPKRERYSPRRSFRRVESELM